MAMSQKQQWHYLLIRKKFPGLLYQSISFCLAQMFKNILLKFSEILRLLKKSALYVVVPKTIISN
jgi:hypothetical protein